MMDRYSSDRKSHFHARSPKTDSIHLHGNYNLAYYYLRLPLFIWVIFISTEAATDSGDEAKMIRWAKDVINQGDVGPHDGKLIPKLKSDTNTALRLEQKTTRPRKRKREHDDKESKAKKRRKKSPGVKCLKSIRKWIAEISEDGTKHRIGYFDTEADAAQAYRDAKAVSKQKIPGALKKHIDNLPASETTEPIAPKKSKVSKRKKQTSEHKGVFRRKDGRWDASITLNYKKYRLGIYSDEKDAAKAYQTAHHQIIIKTFEEVQAHRKFLRDAQKSSRFRGVSWNKKDQKYSAKIQHKKKSYYLGLYDDEEDAAKIYRMADYMKEQGEWERFWSEFEESKKSKIRGAQWSPEKQKWRVKISVNGKQHFLGDFGDKEAAVREYDRAASLRNQGEKKFMEYYANKKKKSKYRNVKWNSNKQKWSVNIKRNRKAYDLGFFDEAEEDIAGEAVKMIEKLRKRKGNDLDEWFTKFKRDRAQQSNSQRVEEG